MLRSFILGILAIGLDVRAAAISLRPLVTGLDQPVQLVAAHDGSGLLYVALQPGRILTLDPRHGTTTPFLDLTGVVQCCSNGGLLSVVFHPAYAVNGYLYVLYVDFNGDTVLARYTRSDPSTAQILFVAPQPKDNVPNHHGGTLLFGRDGFLYASIGDGGAYVRITNRAQELTHLLGKLLRLDVDHRTPYSIPGDNPLVNVAGARGEIWSYGLRNPWRFSFDRLSGDVLIGDVGQDSWEEVDINTLAETRGANYGWPLLEANHCLPAPAPCPAPAGLTTPKLEYPHTLGCSIAGGYRYRGSRWPGLYGVYLYGDYCSGRIWGATESATGSWSASELLHIDSFIVSFGEDDDGELYLVDRKGTIFAIAGTLPARRRAAL